MKTSVPILISCVLLLSGCALPPVQLTTPEPVKVDINVRLDVYQHEDKKKTPAAPESSSQDTGKIDINALKKQSRNRMGDIQLFKNNRVIGENHLALLKIRNKPPGEWGTYIETTVTAENKDRQLLMKHLADKDNTSLEAVQKTQAKLRRDQAFNGEWIEILNPNGNWTWQQKGKT